jgi:hypothetical protein
MLQRIDVPHCLAVLHLLLFCTGAVC